MTGFLHRGRRGFTLVEIMIVVLIIGILLAIAVPNYVKARETSRAKSCVENLRTIAYAKEQWCVEFRKQTSDVPAMTDLVGSSNYIKSTPSCPSGGTYTINDMLSFPTCSIGTNGGAPVSQQHLIVP